jgi:hypothetical protein
MKRGTGAWVAVGVAIVGATVYAGLLIGRGFSAAAEPSSVEKIVARAVRNLAIPGRARKATNPWKANPALLKEAREEFTDRFAVCHGIDGSGQTTVGRNLYPKAPDLRSPQTQGFIRRTDSLHHPQWRPSDWHARLGQSS